MNLTAFLLIFMSVFMHAAWNFMSKKDSPSIAFYMLAAFAASLFFIPAAFCSGIDFVLLPGKFWWLFLISNFFEILYFVALSYGYRKGDISLVYPLGRSLPILLIAVITAIFGIGKTPSPVALAGMGVIFCGCMIMPLKKWNDFKLTTYCNKLLFWVIMIAIGTTGYTIFDNIVTEVLAEIPARNALMRTLFYIFIVEAGITVTLIFPVFMRKKEREELKKIYRSYSPYVAGIFSALAYVLVLLAMRHVSNVSYVQAFRQMSLPIGVLAGIFILKESCTAPKITGIVMVITGLVMTSF